MKPQKNTPEFLAGGGEMGGLMRNFDWSKTPVGPVDNWPQSLKTILSLLLNSKFPMFLWWGSDLTCFYNDAYRPSLGQNGKHPSILGSPAKEAWAEIWHVIGPLIETVLETGEAIWFEDQLVPIYRNGHIEDVYWTFSYSPVVDDSGKRSGVFVTCTETTGKVILFKGLEESNKRFLNNILQAPVAMCIFRGENHVVEIANERMLELWGKNAKQVINKPIFEGLPEVKGQGLEAVVDHVYRTGERFVANERPVGLPRNGKVETVHVNFTYEALREPDGNISGIVAIATDVSPQVMARQKIEESEQDMRNMVLQAPIGICILDAATLVSEIVNDSFVEVAGKPYKEIAGKHYWDTFAEAKPYYESALTSVVEKGKPFFANEVPLMLVRHGKEEQIYVTFVYAPLKTTDGKVKKIAVWVLENTPQVIARQKIEEAEARLRNTILQAPVAMCILTGPHFIVELANEKMFELWGRTPAEMMNKPLFEGVYEAKNHGFEELIESVYRTGKTISKQSVATKFLRNSSLERGYVDVIYHPYRNTDGTITGVLAVATDTTPQVLAHRKIEEAEEKTRIALNSAELGMYEIVYATNEMLTDTRFKEIWGINESGSWNKYMEVIHPDDMPAREQAHKESLQTGHVEYRCRVIWQDTSIHWVKVNGKVIYDEMGTPVKLVGVIQDITSIIDALEQIEENEGRLRLATDAGGIATFDLDLQTDKIIYSDSLAEIFGFDKEKHKGHIDLRKSIHEEDRDSVVVRAFDKAMRTGTIEYEARVVKPNDTIGWIRTEGKVFYDENKKPLKLIGTIRDITKEKHHQQKLQENEKRLNIVIDASELGMWEVHLKTEEVSYSDRYLEIFGYQKGTLINHQQ